MVGDKPIRSWIDLIYRKNSQWVNGVIEFVELEDGEPLDPSVIDERKRDFWGDVGDTPKGYGT